MLQNYTIPVVMSFSTSDPTGGSGIQADIETLFGLGCHCTAVITSISVQNTLGFKDQTPTETSLVIEQARAILEDMPVSAFKIGVVGSLANLVAIHTIVKEYPKTPIVLSIPYEALGTLDNPEKEMVSAITTMLCPLTTCLSIDASTAPILAPDADNLDTCAQILMELGCEYVLIKDYSKDDHMIKNRLYGNHRLLETFDWERVPGEYHGCGCTLSASLAGLLAHGLVMSEAVIEAQKYTLDCIKQGYHAGMGSQLPNRLFWARRASA